MHFVFVKWNEASHMQVQIYIFRNSYLGHIHFPKFISSPCNQRCRCLSFNMATGGCVEHSEEVLDFICSPCSAKIKTRKAEKFCETCNSYYCKKCLQYHDEIFVNHHQLEPEELKNKSIILLPTERCDRHRNELMQMFCKDHDKVVCNTCVSMFHRSCTAVVLISSEIQTLLTPSTLATVKAELTNTKTTLKNDEESGKAQLRKLNDKKNVILKSIEKHGKRLKEIIDDMTEKSMKEIQEKYKVLEDQFQDEINKNQENQSDLEQSMNQLDIAEKQKNDSQMFVSMKKCLDKITLSEKHHADLTAWSETIQLEYKINIEIEKSLKKFTSLGSAIEQHKQSSLYTKKGLKTVPVCQDGTRCEITGSCQLQDGSFLLTDYTHKKVVHLDSSCSRITDQCPVPDSPYAVCLTGVNEAAVSLVNSRTIQFVSMETKMALTRSVKLHHACRGLAFSQGELFVSDMSYQVYVYDTAGNQLRTLGTSTPGQGSVFSDTDHIAVSIDGKRVYVANSTGLLSVDRTGKQLFTYTDSQLQNAFGVCTDDRGSVFVCGYCSHNVIQLTEDGQMLGVLLQQSDGLQLPFSVCFDKRNKRLLVTKDRNNFVPVFELE